MQHQKMKKHRFNFKKKKERSNFSFSTNFIFKLFNLIFFPCTPPQLIYIYIYIIQYITKLETNKNKLVQNCENKNGWLVD